jgi:hypothetical protein
MNLIMPKIIKDNNDLFLIILISLFLTSFSFLTQSYEKGAMLYLRWVLGLFFVYVLSGYPFTVALYPKEEISFSERLMLSSGISMLLTYPAGILNEIYEGKVNVFIPHLAGDMTAMSGLVLLGSILALHSRNKENTSFKFNFNYYTTQFFKNKIEVLLAVNLVLFFVLSILNIGKAGIYNDEWNLIKQSYNLVDGNLAARNAYTISFVDHSPLGNFIGHFTMQLINPLGLHMINDVWIFRISSVIVGMLGILFVYIMAKKMFDSRVGLIASVLVAVSGYHVVMTSIFFPRDAYQMPFMIIALYFYFRNLNGNNKDVLVSGLFLGASMLVKFPAVLLVPVLWTINLNRAGKLLDKKLINIFIIGIIVFSPVLFYNIGAYLTTGYTDVPFSKLIGNPMSPNGPNIREYGGYPFSFQNLITSTKILYEQFSSMLFVLFFISVSYAIFKLLKNRNRDELDFFIIWATGTILFFWIVGAGIFYLHPITAPFAILSGYFIMSAYNKYKLILIAALFFVLLYSSQYAYIVSSHDLTPKGNRYFPGYGSAELKNFLTKNYNVNEDMIVVADETTHAMIGWDISTIIMQKMSINSYDYPELKGIKDMNYKRSEFQEKGFVTFNNKTLILGLSNFSFKNLTKYNKTIIILPRQTHLVPGAFIADPESINAERYEISKIKSESIISKYQPSMIMNSSAGNPTFYIYVLTP